MGPALLVRVRLVSGLVLFVFVTTHFVNHALGLISLGAMEDGREWFLLLWRNAAGTVLLYGALLTHFCLALWSLYRRRHLRMPLWEALQLLLGLTIPPLLVGHVVATRIGYELVDAIDAYTRFVLVYWQLRPDIGVRQEVALAVTWIHGCIGLHFWLRLRRWYPRWAPALLALAVLLPVLASLGFVQAGREVAAQARQASWVKLVMETTNAPVGAALLRLQRIDEAVLLAFAASLGAVLLARAARRVARGGIGTVRITYPDRREVAVPAGWSVLEASRFARIPHASVCGGRGRCSTCRVRIVDGREALPEARPAEQRVLQRIGAPPDVRLACQLRPTRNVTVTPLLAAIARPADGIARPPQRAGQELEVAVLFADLRGFTRLAEHKLPYDVVFFLNRYFETVGGAVKRAGGVANQFTGDGVMALFGVDGGGASASRQALVAAGEMVASVEALSRQLADDLPAPLRIGIGIHAGPAVVGEMGYAEGLYLTAVGDTVHVAARLEQLTKQYACELVVSEHVAQRAELDASTYARHELTLRNRQEPLAVLVIEDARAAARALGAGV